MASWATQGTVSQAAALALRQLQDQLGAAYLENTKLQDEAARDRAEALQIAQGQHKELEQSETVNAALKDQLGEMQGLLQEMRVALESTADENAALGRQVQESKAEVAALTLQLASSRAASDEASRRVRSAETRAASALLMTHNAEEAAAQHAAAAVQAEQKARDAEQKAARLQAQLDTLQQDLRARTEDSQQQLQDTQATVDRLRAEVTQLTQNAQAVTMVSEAEATLQGRLQLAQEQLGREATARISAEATCSQQRSLLEGLQQEAAALRQAAVEHAREMADMRTAAENAERYLDQERGLRTTLGEALRRAEDTMQHVTELNQSMVESLMHHQGQGVPHHMQGPPAVRAKLQGAHAAVQRGTRHKRSQTAQTGTCPPLPPPLSPRSLASTHLKPRWMGLCAQRPPSPGQALAMLPAGPAKVSGNRAAWGGPASRRGNKAGPTVQGAALQQTREQLNAVLLSLEDELSVLDLRYADLLRQAQEHCSSEAEDAEMQQEEIAQGTARVLESMQRKGQQIQQLQAYCCVLG